MSLLCFACTEFKNEHTRSSFRGVRFFFSGGRVVCYIFLLPYVLYPPPYHGPVVGQVGEGGVGWSFQTGSYAESLASTYPLIKKHSQKTSRRIAFAKAMINTHDLIKLSELKKPCTAGENQSLKAKALEHSEESSSAS